MAVFRRARGNCPVCGRDKRINVADAKRKAVEASCCDQTFKLPVDTAWWCSYRDPQGRNRTKRIGPDRALAKSVEAKLRTEVIEGTYLDRRQTCTVTLGEALRQYENAIEPTLKPAVFKGRMQCLRRTCEAFGLGILLDQLTEKEVEAFRTERLRAGLKSGSVTTMLARLRAFLSWCVRMKLITARPRISTPAPNNGRIRFLTETEATNLLEAARSLPKVGAALGDYLETLLFTGMRRTEALELRWSWVDLGRNVINLPGEFSKNKHPRPIPLAQEVTEILKRRRGEAEPGCPYVFVDDGARLTDRRAECAFWKARDKAGLKDKPGFHVLRHTCASWLTMKGVNIVTVAEILGHRDLATTRQYSHLSDDHLQAAVKSISLKPPAEPTDGSPATNEPMKDDRQVIAKENNVIQFPKKTGS